MPRRLTDRHLSFVIDRDEWADLSDLARADGISVAEYARRAINRYFETNGIQATLEQRKRGRKPKEMR